MAIKRIPPPIETVMLDSNGIVTPPWANYFNSMYKILDETVWDDIRTPSNTSKAVAGSEAGDQAYKGGVVLAFSTTSDNAIAFNVQLPHKYQLGGDIEFHIHYALPTAGAGAGVENVKWDLTYSWSSIDAAIPDATTVTKTIDVQNLSAHTHYVGEIAATIDGTGQGISSMLICSLTRDISVANDYAAAVYVMEVDFHIPEDTRGASQEFVK